MKECRVIERVKDNVEVKVMPADNVLRRIERLKERGIVTHMVFRELADIVNEMRADGKEVIEITDTVPVRTYTGKIYYEVSVRLGDGGRHLKSEDIEEILSWALDEFGKRAMSNEREDSYV